MRILQVISSFPPAYAYGGPARVAYGISKELVKRGHKLSVYMTDVYDSNSRFKYDENPFQMDGIKVYFFKNINNKLAHKNLAIAPTMAIALNKSVKDFDIVHLHEYRYFQAILVHHYAKKYGILYILQAHGSLPVDVPKQTLKKCTILCGGHNILRDAAKVIAVTQTEAEQYKSMGVSEDKIEIVPNGIDLAEFDNLPPKGEFRRKYGLSSEQKIILYLGRIHQTKGIDLLVKVFAEVIKELPNTKLVIVSPDDGYLPVLKKLIKELQIDEEVILVGPLCGKDKLEAYVDADVFATPSYYGFPVTFVEACVCGVPIITTQAEDRLDWLHGRAGFVVPYDKKQLQQAILYMLSDEKMGQEFGEKGKLLVREEFNWEKIAEQVEGMYRDILRSTGRIT